MARSRFAVLGVAISVLVHPVSRSIASPTSIGVFFDAEATECDASVAPFSPFTVYVSAILGDDAGAGGIRGAVFRVAGLEGFVQSFTPGPSVFKYVGDPTQEGCNITFETCMGGDGPSTAILLYTIRCAMDESASPLSISVSHVATPSGDPPQLYVNLCDEPQYSKFYVSGGQAVVNNGRCSVGVELSTWSAVKSLFRANRPLQLPAGSVGR